MLRHETTEGKLITIQPERLYRPFEGNANLNIGDIVSATVLDYDYFNRVAYCKVGTKLADILFENLNYPEDNGEHIQKLVGKQVVGKITKFHTDNSFEINRKILLQETMDFLSNSIGTIVDATVEAIVPYGVFIDIGNGINSLLPLNAMSKCRYENPYGHFEVGDNVKVKIINFDPLSKHFTVSRKLAYEVKFPAEKAIVPVFTSSYLDDKGIYVEYNPATSGIMDIPSGLYLPPNVEVYCYVKKVIPSKGFKSTYVCTVNENEF